VVLAYGPYVLPQLKSLGLRVPQDVAFADIFLCESSGEIAGVHQNCDRVGEVTVETLVSQLNQNLTGLPQFPTAILVEGTWHDGASLPPMRPLRGNERTRCERESICSLTPGISLESGVAC
jgi:hypothetical protein